MDHCSDWRISNMWFNLLEIFIWNCKCHATLFLHFYPYILTTLHSKGGLKDVLAPRV
jgi:hypothetical protein